TGIEGTMLNVGHSALADRGIDAEIAIMVSNQPRRYAVECKSAVDRRAQAHRIREQLHKVSGPSLLIAPYISREIARYCREIDLQFIDTHGNAFLNGPGLFVYTSGELQETGMKPARAVAGITSPVGLRVAFGLLCRPDLVKASYREIAGATGVSLGAVGSALNDLERRGHLIDAGTSRHRQLLAPQRLLDEWALNYPIRLKPKLNSQRFSIPNQDWWVHEQLEGVDAVWGGEVAAERVTQYLKPATQTLYVDASARSACLKKLVMTHRAKPDPHGSLEILDKFWGHDMVQQPGIAPAVLVYADLLALLDPRASETAELIRKAWLNDSLDRS
ncbi:MAG: type IV toxin-antitoxin system AbiEi family antitoxin, partial [Gammaproteobacteria bacterium]